MSTTTVKTGIKKENSPLVVLGKSKTHAGYITVDMPEPFLKSIQKQIKNRAERDRAKNDIVCTAKTSDDVCAFFTSLEEE